MAVNYKSNLWSDGYTPIQESITSVYTSDAFEAHYEAASSTTPGQVKAGTASKSIYVTDVSISTDTAQWIRLEDNTGTPITAVSKKYLPANSVWSKTFKVPLKVAAGKDLNIDCGGSSGNVSVDITGYVI